MEKSDKIIPKYLMELHHDKNKLPKELEKTKKTIYKPLKQNIVSPDYQRYETVLSKEFQVDQVKYVKDLPEVKDPVLKNVKMIKKIEKNYLIQQRVVKVNGVNGIPNIAENLLITVL